MNQQTNRLGRSPTDSTPDNLISLLRSIEDDAQVPRSIDKILDTCHCPLWSYHM